nr:hypothetical protein BaRGS_022809 [Batillaria attramentaria]
MVLSVSHVLLPFLVALATAAPLAEETNNLEQAVNVNGDNNVVDRAKRAKEEIVFGNQQNGGRPAMSKKSFNVPLLMEGQDFNMPPPSPVDPGTQDKSGYVYAAQEKPVPPELQPPAVGEPQAIVEESKQVVEESKPIVEELESKVPELPAADVASEKSEQEAESGSGKGAETGSGEATAVEEVASPQVDTEPQVAVVNQLPADSKDEDAEEVLEGQRQSQNQESDEVESLLEELHEESEKGGERKEDLMEEEEEKQEQSDEADLQQVSSDSQEMDMDDSEYSRKLLQILLNQDRLYPDRMYPYYPPYLQRRRRSLAHKRLPHIHSRHRSKALARAKRTKRDLLDDDLYYNEDEGDYDFQPETSDASLQELMGYLLSLYPSLYEPQSPPQQEFPGYNWFGQGYPEESYPAPEIPVPEWEEPDYGPEYVEVPVGWEAVAPGWEPAFYPEEMEEESPYYPAPAKRQMLSFVPGQRRKRYFFPFAREPYTHWGAFVPAQDKRNYEDAYRRLRELALVLADARKPSSYSDAFEEYKKKK